MTSETVTQITAGPRPMIEIGRLHKCLGQYIAVKFASLQVGQGEAQFIIGPSRCGKSLFVLCIDPPEVPTHGSMRVGETPLEFGPKAKPVFARQRAAFRARA